ncbi:MAG: integrase arm-type DNA-binding domain-containing protein [Alphaproteobacteria bacterium]|nr:integrase arm-type DNA-binding domain-containing protein [Alphaproteobacteria bacterium]
MGKEKKTLTAAAIKRFPPAPPGKRVEHFDAAFPGFALRVTDKGEKSFVLLTRLQGKLLRLTIGRAQVEENGAGFSLADARQRARALLIKCQKGEDPRAEAKAAAEALKVPPPSVFTVQKAVEAYEKGHISRLKPRSQLEARRPLEKILLARWPDRALAEVTKRDIREALADVVDAGHPVAANRSLANLRAFFGWAMSEDRLETNPCVGIRPPGGDETSRDRVLSDDEIALLWPLMDEADYPFGYLARLLLVTAQRRDEVANMRWSETTDLNGPNPVWTIPASKNKGGRMHEVPLSPLAVRILSGIPRIAVRADADSPLLPTDLVFTTNGTRPISGFSGGKERLDELTAARLAITGQAPGVSPPALARWTLHDLRRTAASGMARAGIPPHIVSRVLNHSPGKTEGITAVYNRHGYLVEKRAALGCWANRLESIVLSPPEKT